MCLGVLRWGENVPFADFFFVMRTFLHWPNEVACYTSDFCMSCALLLFANVTASKLCAEIVPYPNSRHSWPVLSYLCAYFFFSPTHFQVGHTNCHTDQQKVAWFESNFYVSCAACITTLLTTDRLFAPNIFTDRILIRGATINRFIVRISDFPNESRFSLWNQFWA